MPKTKNTKEEKTKKQRNYAPVMGLLQLFVVVSNLFMAYVVIGGVDNLIAQLLTAPALIWSALVLVSKFTK